MSNTLPDRGQDARNHHEEEEVLQDDGETRQVRPVDINPGKARDGAASGDVEQPIPRPTPADSAEALLRR